uniref:Uncharacterized protein n=1 Tax=Spongospora subterranea TaxID=70186 RepID=A0A0H5QZY4_9EUKA|eukprot:CRZ01139.1 hypothetical protein [Spongospora subterranea]
MPFWWGDILFSACSLIEFNLIVNDGLFALPYSICRPDIIVELIMLIVSGSTDPLSSDSRFAHVASETIACDVRHIIDAIMESDAAMELLFSVVCEESEGSSMLPPIIDARRAGEFRKVLAVLIRTKYDEMAEYIVAHPNIIPALIRHIANTAILEVIIMLGWDDGNLENSNNRRWLFDLKFVPSLVKALHSDLPELVHINAGHGLIDMILKCPPTASSLLVNHLTSPQVFSTLIANVISGSASSYENGLGVLSVVVQRYAFISQDVEAGMDSFFDDVPFPVQNILNSLEKILGFVKDLPLPDPMPSPMGVPLQPLGTPRLKAAELVLALLRTGHHSVQAKLVEVNAIPLILSYFFDFKWNSILHFITENVAANILAPPGNVALQKEFLLNGKFAAKALDLYQQHQLECRKRRFFQFGQMGYIIRICNLIVELAENQHEVNEWVHPDRNAWSAFVDNELANENANLSIQLGGFKPVAEKQAGQRGRGVPSADEFSPPAAIIFGDDTDVDRSQEIFDIINSSASNPFDTELWPVVSFDDQGFDVLDGDDVFGPITAFSSEESIVVDPRTHWSVNDSL